MSSAAAGTAKNHAKTATRIDMRPSLPAQWHSEVDDVEVAGHSTMPGSIGAFSPGTTARGFGC